MDDHSDKKLIKGVSWIFLINIVIAVLNFTFLMFFARSLGANIMGAYAAIVVGLDLITAVFNFGFNQAAIKTRYDKEVYSAALVAVSVQSLLILFVTMLTYAVFVYIGDSNIESMFIPGLLLLFSRVITNFSTLFYAKLEVDFEYNKIALIRLVSTVLGIAVGYFVLKYQGGIYTLVTRDFIIAALMFSMVVYIAKPSMKFRIKRSSWDDLWVFSSGVWYLNLLERFSLRIDYGIIGLMLGKESLGVYYTIRSIFEGLLGFILSPIQTVLFSFYCGADSKVKIFLKAFRLSMICVILLAIIGLAVSYYWGDFILNKVLGDEYSSGTDMLYGFILMMMSVIIYEHSKVFSMSIGKHLQFILSRLIQIIFLLLLTYPMVTYYGYFGAGMVTGMGALVLMVTSTYIILRQVQKVKV